MVVVIDNYDSFVHNLARYIQQLDGDVKVIRNDAITIPQLQALAPSHIVLSPGPCTPNEAGICLDVVAQLGAHIPILGVCLGHQAIGQAFGGQIIRAKQPCHGKASLITHTGIGIFKDLPQPLTVGRYHSLVIEAASVPEELEVTAWSQQGEIMAVQHRQYPVTGVQFHPESILTVQGLALIENFLYKSV